MDIRGFEAGCQFRDNKHFPVGFSRSGEFTLQQSEILEQYGSILQELEEGELKAKTREQKHFMAVCSGKKGADTLLEKAWLKYRTLTHDEACVSAFGQLKNQSTDEIRASVVTASGSKHKSH
ncbi:MAG: DUF413 domain-containing protein [Pseudomonadales bacterium]|nr:DUF413 domain-containing protein [Pseudomonadales bacterium]